MAKGLRRPGVSVLLSPSAFRQGSVNPEAENQQRRQIDEVALNIPQAKPY
jgi:hypothetical protein